MLTQEYTDFIATVTSRVLSGQYTYYLSGINNDQPSYRLFAYDGPHCFDIDVQDSDSVNDFELKYKASWNKAIEKKDPNTGIPQFKPRPVEATLSVEFVYFTTGDDSTFEAPNDSWSIDTSIPGVTKVSMKPKYSYYIDGGGFTLIGNTIGKSKIAIMLAPNIPESYGGNVKLIKNKKFVRNDENFILEVPPKYVKYYAANPLANEIQMHIEHNDDVRMNIEFYARLYI